VISTSDTEAIIKSDAPKRMVLKFLRDVSRDQMVEACEEAFAANAPASKRSGRAGYFSVTRSTDVMTMSVTGIPSCLPALRFGAASILSTVSMPVVTLPKTA